MTLVKCFLKFWPLYMQIRLRQCSCPSPKPQHLICFKQWTSYMVLNIINSALNLKCRCRDTHHKRMDVLENCKVMILQEINEPILHMAISKAATLLGAYDVNVIDHLIWEQDYNGSVFSYMSDVIFISTSTHMCVQRFAEKSMVPVLCMRSRTHASILSLSTIMAIIEEFGSMRCVNVGYFGAPHPVLNSYLLLCPMLGANFRYKCCCDKCPVSPILKKASEDMNSKSPIELKECSTKDEVLKNAHVVIAGPTASNKEKVNDFKLTTEDVQKNSDRNWVFFHTCPRGGEVDDKLFFHNKSRTFHSFENMHYIAASLMANAVKGVRF